MDRLGRERRGKWAGLRAADKGPASGRQFEAKLQRRHVVGSDALMILAFDKM